MNALSPEKFNVWNYRGTLRWIRILPAEEVGSSGTNSLDAYDENGRFIERYSTHGDCVTSISCPELPPEFMQLSQDLIKKLPPLDKATI